MPEVRDESALAVEILAAGDATRPLAPITDSDSGFDLAAAYRVLGEVVRMRIARGERPVGWKIGFTNETIWDEYGVHAPIWGPMYDSTLAPAKEEGTTICPVGHLSEPRIEPEIALRLAAAPTPDMDEAALLGCVDAVAHGFEIVQSLFPAWRFKAADTVAAFALHGCYRIGPFVEIASDERADWLDRLGRFEIVLSMNGEAIDRGRAGNVLGGGPLTALRHMVRGLAETGGEVCPGEIVTTGTVTRAFPVKPGERWTTLVEGLPLRGMDMTIA